MPVDEPLRSRLVESARAAYQSGCTLLSDAKTLIDTERYCRAGALAILAEEEYSKAFVLCICADTRRWDSVIFRSLENDILDSQYVIAGSLEGALASGDKNVRRLWRLIRPKGELIPATFAS